LAPRSPICILLSAVALGCGAGAEALAPSAPEAEPGVDSGFRVDAGVGETAFQETSVEAAIPDPIWGWCSPRSWTSGSNVRVHDIGDGTSRPDYPPPDADEDALVTPLPDGRAVLGVGETIYDPTKDTYTTIIPYPTPHRVFATGTLLKDGRHVLFAGGDSFGGGIALATIFDTATQTSVTVSPMNSGRRHHHAALLPDGRVLVVGGQGSGVWTAHVRAETYDPAKDSWSVSPTPVGFMGDSDDIVPKITVTSLPTGDVVVTDMATCSLYLYEAAMDAWEKRPGPPRGYGVDHSQLLTDGRVLMTGYVNCPLVGEPSMRADIYDPVADEWQTVPAMNHARVDYISATLPCGVTVISSGHFIGSGAMPTEVLDASTLEWHDIASADPGRWGQYLSAALLADGRWLVAFGKMTDDTSPQDFPLMLR